MQFLRMSDDFILFVKSYRSGDSIGVEKGYEWYVPIWKALGQHKYVARYHEQLEQLLVKFKYQRLHECRLNRFVRTYPWSTGKHTIAHDEYLELQNRLFAMFLKMRSTKGMVNCGNYVGLAQRCKRFARRHYASAALSNITKITRAGTKGDQTPERRMLYEVVALLLNYKGARKLTVDLLEVVGKRKKTKHWQTGQEDEGGD